jgi:hypothetical protein
MVRVWEDLNENSIIQKMHLDKFYNFVYYAKVLSPTYNCEKSQKPVLQYISGYGRICMKTE